MVCLHVGRVDFPSERISCDDIVVVGERIEMDTGRGFLEIVSRVETDRDHGERSIRLVIQLRNPVDRFVILNRGRRALSEIGHFRGVVKLFVDETATVKAVYMGAELAGADNGVEASDDGRAIDLDTEMVGAAGSVLCNVAWLSDINSSVGL